MESLAREKHSTHHIRLNALSGLDSNPYKFHYGVFKNELLKVLSVVGYTPADSFFARTIRGIHLTNGFDLNLSI